MPPHPAAARLASWPQRLPVPEESPANTLFRGRFFLPENESPAYSTGVIPSGSTCISTPVWMSKR